VVERLTTDGEKIIEMITVCSGNQMDEFLENYTYLNIEPTSTVPRFISNDYTDKIKIYKKAGFIE